MGNSPRSHKALDVTEGTCTCTDTHTHTHTHTHTRSTIKERCLTVFKAVMKFSTPDDFKEFIKTMGSSLCGGRRKQE